MSDQEAEVPADEGETPPETAAAEEAPSPSPPEEAAGVEEACAPEPETPTAGPPAPESPKAAEPSEAEVPAPEPEAAAAPPPKTFVPPPRASWAAAATIDEVAMSDAALTAAYLRRLGFNEDEVATMATGRPFSKGGSNKALLSDLVQRHILHVPFENLEQHRTSPLPAGARKARLRDIKPMVQRLVSSFYGGVCFDLNPAFAWLLRQLGAKARLAMAWVADQEMGGFTPQATHCVVLVDLPDGAALVDPGFGDPPRTALRLEGETPDDLALYEVVTLDEAGCPGPGYTKAVLRSRGSNSLGRHIDNPDESSLDETEASSHKIYAFRPDDDLAPDSEDLQRGLETILTGPGLFADRRLVCLATPKGHVVLSERRMRKVEGGTVTEETEIDGEETWRKMASEILSSPLLCRGLKMGKAVATTRKVSTPPTTSKIGQRWTDQMTNKSGLGQEVEAARSKIVSANSIAVGGAGKGGGLGLNAPGFGKPVQHFSGGGGGGNKLINVDEEIKKAWKQVMDDSDPLRWIFCEYSADGKALELTRKGEGGLSSFKEQLGSGLGWGGFRCCAVDRRGGLEARRPKFVFVQYKPEAVSAMKKAKTASHKGEVKDSITGAHLEVVVETQKDLDEQALIEKLQTNTGAHKPNGYEFEEGVFLEADFYGLGIGKDCKNENSKN